MRLGLRGILFDLDGVLYNAAEAIAGAAETLTWTRRRQIPCLFVTNTTSRPRSALVEKLAGFGIEAREDEILTPPAAAVAWLRSQPKGKLALFVKPETRSDFEGLPQVDPAAEEGAGYVVIGDLGHDWDYATLNRAFRLLHNNPDAVLVALGMTRFWQAPDGVSLDVAPFVAALEHATCRRAVVLGKPAQPFFQAAANRLGLEPSEILMIGDDVVSDVGGAQQAGVKGMLVKTGKFRRSDLDGDVRPDAVVGSVADLPGWWDG